MLEPEMKPMHFIGLHWARVWNQHDGAGMAALFHPHGKYTDPFAGTIGQGRIAEMIARIDAEFPDFLFELVGAVAQANVRGKRTLALQWRMTGTHARTKKAIDFPGVDFLEFDGGLIEQVNTYFDMGELARQAGLGDKELVFELR